MNHSNSRTVARPTVDAVRTGLIAGSPPCAERRNVVAGLGERVRAAGIPVDRFACLSFALHPDSRRRPYIWQRGRPVEVRAEDLAGNRSATST